MTKFLRCELFSGLGLRLSCWSNQAHSEWGGSAIALWNNAVSVLDVLGIGGKFRTWFTNLLEYAPCSYPIAVAKCSLQHGSVYVLLCRKFEIQIARMFFANSVHLPLCVRPAGGKF